jgi:transaldolase
MTVVVCDTGDLASIKKFTPRDATTNPSLITTAAQMPEYQDVVDGALDWAKTQPGAAKSVKKTIAYALDRLAVEFGLRILQIVPGRVSTEVDARLSYDTKATIEKGRHLIQQYEAAGASRERVLIKIASTWEGIRAAEVLQKEGINCNLTLLFGMHQAIACAEAGAKLISPFVGRILDWFKKHENRESYPPNEDPGVLSVTKIYNYYKKFGYQTEVMGASFRNLGEIVELAGSDLLTIAPNLLAELSALERPLERKLDPEKAKSMPIEKISMDETTFRRMHDADPMAKEKLEEGIQGFSKAIVALEKLLTERYRGIQSKSLLSQAHQFFKVYDLDGDGLITREEWAGADAVFDALDVNRKGAITVAELVAGLGAAQVLKSASARPAAAKVA